MPLTLTPPLIDDAAVAVDAAADPPSPPPLYIYSVYSVVSIVIHIPSIVQLCRRRCVIAAVDDDSASTRGPRTPTPPPPSALAPLSHIPLSVIVAIVPRLVRTHAHSSHSALTLRDKRSYMFVYVSCFAVVVAAAIAAAAVDAVAAIE